MRQDPSHALHAVAPSGRQHRIAAGSYRAVVVSAGAGLRRLSHRGRQLLDGYAADRLPDGARGQVLAPWPNRLRDGRWQEGDRVHQLPIDDVLLGHAVHGLVRWLEWTTVLQRADRVVLRCRLPARPGYPFSLELTADYCVQPTAGLVARLTAVNVGSGTAPVALGAHPYLAVPDGARLDDCWLQVPARTRLLVDDRRIPTGTSPVAHTPYDLRRGRVLGGLELDDAFTDLEASDDGRVRVLLRPPGGRTTELWTEDSVRWLQLFTGDTLTAGRRRGLAVEPMTAPANALATGTGVARLLPGQELELRWGLLDGSPG